MTEHSRPAPDLASALEAFLATGFHAASIAELEAATGLDWQTLRERYGDKEGLFYAAADSADEVPDISRAEAERMVARLIVANRNPRLRAIHRTALNKISALTTETEQLG